MAIRIVKHCFDLIHLITKENPIQVYTFRWNSGHIIHACLVPRHSLACHSPWPDQISFLFKVKVCALDSSLVESPFLPT